MSQLESRNINQTDLFFISTIMHIVLSWLVHSDVFYQIVVEGGRVEGAKERKENKLTDEIALTAV